MSNREIIERLALDNPVIHSALRAHQSGMMRYNEALEVMVVHLVGANEALQKTLLKALQEQRAPLLSRMPI